MTPAVLHHIPVCPFSQRLEILLALKGLSQAIRFNLIDITKPRPEALMQKTGGSTALPVLVLADGRVLKESLVILQYLEDIYTQTPVAQRDPYRRAVENMLVRLEGPFGNQGYGLVMNQVPARREAMMDAMRKQYALLNAFLLQHAVTGPFLFDQFGWAEAVFTPFFMRFWFLEYFEDFQLPAEPAYARVRQWIDACLAHPCAQQVSKEQIVKLYYDYAKGAGNGALLPGRKLSSFTFNPDWPTRPWPPRDKYGHSASDEELGLIPRP